MYTVYILKSSKNDRYYIGHTKDIDERITRHNSGRVPFTKKFMPWQVIYTEIYSTKSDAYKREVEIKNFKGGIPFKRLLGLWKDK